LDERITRNAEAVRRRDALIARIAVFTIGNAATPDGSGRWGESKPSNFVELAHRKFAW
jgi:hypothetical protein